VVANRGDPRRRRGRIEPRAADRRPGTAAGQPQWSPNGRRIAFDSQREDRTFDVYVIDAAGGPPRRLTPDASNEHRPSWSRDGRWIYFASDRTGRFEVWRLPADGGGAERLTDEGGYACFESFGRSREVARLDVPVAPGLGLTVSPDRRTILFTAFKPNDADLFLIENFH
jgi:dipeptidyl aminopeptidase/acylaminoacyl peptidase